MQRDDEAGFKKLARRRKEERAQALRGKRDRARSINMANAAEVIGRMFPGASKRVARELAILHTKAVASAFIMAFDKMTTQAPVATVSALRETSVLFGALLGVWLLKEAVTLRRVVATCAIVAGAMALRLA